MIGDSRSEAFLGRRRSCLFALLPHVLESRLLHLSQQEFEVLALLKAVWKGVYLFDYEMHFFKGFVMHEQNLAEADASIEAECHQLLQES